MRHTTISALRPSIRMQKIQLCGYANMDEQNMRMPIPDPSDPIVSKQDDKLQGGAVRWLRIGVIAAASGLVGGLAVAWYYRKTLENLHQSDETGRIPPASGDHDYDI